MELPATVPSGFFLAGILYFLVIPSPAHCRASAYFFLRDLPLYLGKKPWVPLHPSCIWVFWREFCLLIRLLIAWGNLVGGAPPNLDNDTRPGEGLARGKGRKTVPRAGARRLGQLSSPDMSPPVRHLRTPSLVRHLGHPLF